MKRNAYIVLCIVAIGLLGYTSYYAYNSTRTAEKPVLSTSTPSVATTTVTVPDDKNVYVTNAGKKIKILETNPNGESLSSITITPEGFIDTTPITLEVNKLTNSSIRDLNNDSFEELILTTMAQGSGSFGEVFLYTTASNSMLLPITVPEITEEETQKGGLFEGYMGHDSFTVTNGRLERSFPTYKKEDPNNNPTGPTRSVVYTIVEKNGEYLVLFTKGASTSGVLRTQIKPQSSSGTTSSPSTATSTTTPNRTP